MCPDHETCQCTPPALIAYDPQVRERAADGSVLKYTQDPTVTQLARPARDLTQPQAGVAGATGVSLWCDSLEVSL